MVPLPNYITRAFAEPRPEKSDAACYYGPYNTLLHYLFPASQGFEVVPFPQPGHDRSLLFIVKKFKSPVLFFDVRAPLPPHTTDPTPFIEEAMRDMSHALRKILAKTKGISMFGPMFVVYEYEYDAAANELDAHVGSPALIEGGEGIRDIRTEEGMERMKEMARCIGGNALE